MTASLSNELRDQLLGNRAVRKEVTKRDPLLFTNIYMPEVITYEMAPMHHEMFSMMARPELELVCCMAFRGSGKSTLLTFVYPIWSIIGIQQKKFVMIFSKTQDQARSLLEHIKKELETNALLRAEMGPFESQEDEWGVSSIVLKDYNARISAASVDQSVRGLRHNTHRPDLIILDDVEDQKSVNTSDQREKLAKWYSGEVLPLGDIGTKVVLVGNKLHDESLIMRVASTIDGTNPSAIARTYAIIDSAGNSAWPGKYPNLESLNKLESRINDHVTWMREYMQEIVAEEDQLITQQDIHYYQDNDLSALEPRMTITSVDLASSMNSRADCTAILTAYISGYGRNMKIYILPIVANERLTFTQIIDLLHGHAIRYPGRLVVESVAAQEFVPQELRSRGIAVDSWRPTNDKYTRLYAISSLIQDGTIVFGSHGCKKLIDQLIGFGSERHDDLVDALTMLALFVRQHDNERENQGSIHIGKSNFYRRSY